MERPERTSPAYDGGVDRAVANGCGPDDGVLGRTSVEAVLRLSAEGIAGPPHPAKGAERSAQQTVEKAA